MDVDDLEVTSTTLVNVRPTHFSILEKTQFLELDDERLCVRYVGKAQHHHDVGISSLDSYIQFLF
jgi:hypothetical protein